MDFYEILGVAFTLGLKQPSGTEIHQNLANSTSGPLKYSAMGSLNMYRKIHQNTKG